jgi:hypothetical protein
MMRFENSIVLFWLLPVLVQIILPLAMLLVLGVVKLPAVLLRLLSASKNVERGPEGQVDPAPRTKIAA